MPIFRHCLSFGTKFVSAPEWPFLVMRMVLVSAVPVFLFLYHDPNRHYLWTTDMDFQLMYESLLYSSDLPQFMGGYAGYGTSFLNGSWLLLVKALGGLDIVTIDAIPHSPPGSDAAFQEIIFWMRVLALLVGCALIYCVMFMAQILSGSVYYGFLAALAFSGTRSVNTNVLHLRAEQTSALFAFLAIIFILMAVKWEGVRWRSLFFVGVTGFCALFAMYAKLSSLPIIVLLPLFALVLSSELAPATKGTAGAFNPSVLLAFIGGAAVIGYFGLGPFFSTMGNTAYIYNGAIVFFVLGCLVVYGRMRDFSPLETAAGGAAVIVGMAVAQLLLLSAEPFSQAHFVTNHLQFLSFAATNKGGEDQVAMGFVIKIATKLLANFSKVMSESYFNFCWVCRRPSIVYLLSLICLGVVWWKYRDDMRIRFNATFLVLCLIFIEAVLWFHYFNHYYRMYVEGLLMVTMAYLLVRISDRSSLKARKILAGVSLIFVVWFWIDDVNRKMLWPTFAAHVGAPTPYVNTSPLIEDRFESHIKFMEDFDKKMKSGELPPGSVPPWWEDNRSFLGRGKPWRTWNNK